MQPCVVFLNGEYWELYEMAEKFSDYFIESNYGIDKKDVAMLKNGELEEGEQAEYDNFMQFVNNYSRKNLTVPENYQAVCDYIDIDSMIEHYAAGLYLGTYDYANEVLTPEKANEMADRYSQEYTEQIANSTVRWWRYFGGSKESNLSYHRNLYRNTTLNQIRTYLEQRSDYTIEDMQNYLGLSGSM